MRRWTRWQDWLATAAGLYALVSPLWLERTTKGMWTLVILGVVTAVVALWSLAMPDNVVPDGIVALLGVAIFVSPWVMSFTAFTGMAWTARIVGVVLAGAGAWAWPKSNKLHHAHMVPSH